MPVPLWSGRAEHRETRHDASTPGGGGQGAGRHVVTRWKPPTWPAAALKMAADLTVEVGGHTDNVGTADANQKLSQGRAQAVMAALVERGVKADRLTAKGYGQSAPVADNRTEDGRARNRSVELVKK